MARETTVITDRVRAVVRSAAKLRPRVRRATLEEEEALYRRSLPARLKVSEAALIAMDHAVEIAQLASSAADTDAFRQSLYERFGFDRIEADAVRDMQFFHLTAAQRERHARRVAELREDAQRFDAEEA